MTRSVSLRVAVPLLIAFLAADTGTQLAFKAAALDLDRLPLDGALLVAAFQMPSVWVAALSYLITYVLWIAILQQAGLGRAFPLTALSYVTVPLGAWALFGERIGWLPATGILLICLGVLVIAAAEDTSSRACAEEDLPCTE
ncbi:hypothetical protein GCM10007301_07470 [Azorhizobium oxalatiphilum]|uniref:EamA-like transporter family protein n=1 Tax=Azorhizobium oxalatiphilum TaxID=980631 RepID=A0A917F770_9HYPH|nr:EamA family transporter [Azorhizobium oxalatiphilum]GGF50601.1 hypothetical protein GCM10007301_07470 [Azorhizobium oxalatiphilum]